MVLSIDTTDTVNKLIQHIQKYIHILYEHMYKVYSTHAQHVLYIRKDAHNIYTVHAIQYNHVHTCTYVHVGTCSI